MQGDEWISVPDTEHIQYIVDAIDVERYAEAINVSEEQQDNLTQTVHLAARRRQVFKRGASRWGHGVYR